MRKKPLIYLNLLGLLLVENPASAYEWTSIAPPHAQVFGPQTFWQAFASSADGNRLVTGGFHQVMEGRYPMPLYTSADSGLSWTMSSAPVRKWLSAGSSADGKHLIAASGNNGDNGGGIYISCDSGKTWIKSAVPASTWGEVVVASSADGTRLAAVGSGLCCGGSGGIYISSDSGLTWNQTLPAENLGNNLVITASADGSRLVVKDYFQLRTSVDAGITWTQATNAPVLGYGSIAMSGNGTKLAAAVWSEEPAPVYISADFGVSWVETSSPRSQWSSVIFLGDENRLAALSEDGQFYVSTDSASTWASNNVPRVYIGYRAGLASSADSTKLFVTSGDIIQSSSKVTPWELSLTLSNGYPISMAASVDGSRLLLADYDGAEYSGVVYASKDSGRTWTGLWGPVVPGELWTSVAISLDGDTLLAGGVGASVLISTNSGRDLTASPGTGGGGIACSADGRMLFAAVGGSLMVSTNSGGTWANTSLISNSASLVACSADGRKVFATGDNSRIWKSVDGGATWEFTVATNTLWRSLACSADASTVIAGSYDGFVFTSINSTTNWVRSIPEPLGLNSAVVACSGDGATLLATGDYGDILISTNSGATWASGLAPSLPWSSIACSGDGSAVVAGSSDFRFGSGAIYTLKLPAPTAVVPLPQLHIDVQFGSLVLSWLVPSKSFVLQESSDLIEPNWNNLSGEPRLNLTNLNYEVTLDRPSGNRFYRLRVKE